MENIQAAWKHIAAYNGTKVGSNGKTYLSGIKTDLGKYVDGDNNGAYKGYKQMHQLMVMDLYDTSNYLNFSGSVGNRSVASPSMLYSTCANVSFCKNSLSLKRHTIGSDGCASISMVKFAQWFAKNAVETSMELGQHMVKCTLEALEEIIV